MVGNLVDFICTEKDARPWAKLNFTWSSTQIIVCNHTRCNDHLHKITIVTSFSCICAALQSPDHLRFVCPKFDTSIRHSTHDRNVVDICIHAIWRMTPPHKQHKCSQATWTNLLIRIGFHFCNTYIRTHELHHLSYTTKFSLG